VFRLADPTIIFYTDTNGYYLLEIRHKDSNNIVFRDTLKSYDKKITIKGFAQNLFAFSLQPLPTSNHWEKILIS